MKKKQLQINKQLFATMILVSLIALSIHGYWNYIDNKNEIMARIDKELYNSAATLKYILPEDFHDRATDPNAISIEEDKGIADKLTRLIKETGFKYTYTIVKKKGSLFFIASDIAADPETKRGTFYFYRYKDADESFYKAFEQKTPTYKTVSDQWGTVRTVMIPEKSKGGVKYLACSDYDISYVKEVLYKNLLKSIATFLFFLLLAVPILIIYKKLHEGYSDSLQESEQRFNLAMNATRDGLWDWNLGTNEIYFSPGWKKMLGYDYDELPNKLSIWEKLTAPEDVERSRIIQQELFNRKRDRFEIEFKMKHKDGHWVDILSRANAFFDKDGNAVRMVGTHVDITKRKEAERALERISNMLTEAQRIAHLGSFEYITATQTFEWSEEEYRIYGLDPAKPLPAYGVMLEKCIHPNDSVLLNETFTKAMQNRSIYELEHRIVRPDGSVRWVYNRAHPYFDDNDNLSRYIGATLDITERKMAEQALRESEQRWQFALEGAGDGVWDWNVQTNEVFFSQQWKSMLGFEDNEIGNTHDEWDKLIHPEDREHTYEEIKKHFNGETPVYVSEHRLKCKDDTYKWILDRGKVITWTEDGKPLRVIGTHTDITERKQAEAERINLEAQLIQAQKMESIGRLAGGVAHDFNNMLSVILGYSEIVLERSDLDLQVHDALQEIKKAAQRSADITRQLLAFARKQTIAPKVLDLNNTVEKMLKMLRRLIGEDIDLVWMPEKNVWYVNMDPSQIDQILANLCVNARDAISSVGKVTIETGNASFDDAYCTTHHGFVPGDFVLLAVSDNGCGMAKETQKNLFEPFFTTKDMDKGTGLGLATVYGIVKQNNGFINVYSEPNKGTTFKIYMPRHRIVKDEVQEKVPVIPDAQGSETILLVEDEPTSLKMTVMMLESLGYTVLDAVGPGQAIDLAHQYDGQVHLLMTDVVMPKMNGRELAGNLLTVCPNLKCLFMSGYTANVIAHHGILDEGVHYIQKPFSKKELSFKVREALDKDKV